MKPFISHTAIAAYLDHDDINTDVIIPKQFLKAIGRQGFGQHLFNDWRYLNGSKDQPNPDFILNQPAFRKAGILLAGRNFGCGSSREHAVWSLMDYGIRAVLATSFADIFYSNAIKNGLLPAKISSPDQQILLQYIQQHPRQRIEIHLPADRITTADGENFSFQLEAEDKQTLLQGLDDITRTLRHLPDIKAYEVKRRQETPWLP